MSDLKLAAVQVRVPKDGAVWVQWMDGEQVIGARMVLPRDAEPIASDRAVKEPEGWKIVAQLFHNACVGAGNAGAFNVRLEERAMYMFDLLIAREGEGFDEDIKADLDAYADYRAAKSAAEGAEVSSPVSQQENGAELIAAERTRQIMVEGWTDSHDDEHDGGQMTAAAYCYGALARRQADGKIRSKAENIGAPSGWPWEQAWWKPSDDPIRNLVKAGALVAAEIDRLQRASGLAEVSSPARPQLALEAFEEIAGTAIYSFSVAKSEFSCSTDDDDYYDNYYDKAEAEMESKVALVRAALAEGAASSTTPAQEQLIRSIEELVGWWGLNREGSVNRSYDYIDKMTKRLRVQLEQVAALADVARLRAPREEPKP
jgi:hypothetical protein